MTPNLFMTSFKNEVELGCDWDGTNDRACNHMLICLRSALTSWVCTLHSHRYPALKRTFTALNCLEILGLFILFPPLSFVPLFLSWQFYVAQPGLNLAICLRMMTLTSWCSCLYLQVLGWQVCAIIIHNLKCLGIFSTGFCVILSFTLGPGDYRTDPPV